ncbi:histidine phosphatase family protein [Paenibacillus oryzisoli]|uniref:histidine phosphatase family protein n=1 Tax=Paenibacillus oryzisoli TaxID=1850517 RepID=UPI003D266287
MTIYFVRHGKDDEGFRGGWSQRGLITEGYRQSEKLGRYLRERQDEWAIHRIVSSDLQRALDTAGEIGRELALPVETSRAWREMNNGVIAGMPNEIVNERFPGLYFSRLRMDEPYPGGESPAAFHARIAEAFQVLCEEQAAGGHEDNVLIVTHGGVINILYHLCKGMAWTNVTHRFTAAYTSIHKVEYLDGTWHVTLENCTDHLSAPLL